LHLHVRPAQVSLSLYHKREATVSLHHSKLPCFRFEIEFAVAFGRLWACVCEE
jgi:hypothetical protein